LAVLLAVGASCTRKPEPAPSALELATNPATESGIASVDPAQLSAMTQAVRKFGVEQRRIPASLQELADKGYLGQIPNAPPGKKFTINKKLEVVVVNQ